MAFANLVRVLSATTGTGTLTLASAVTGFLTPSQAGMVDGSTYSYAIEADYVTVGDDLVPTSREVGTGTYTASGTTLTRSVLNSTNSNALLNLAGDEQVIVTPNALDFVTRTGPTTQSLTSGTSATYTTPAGAKWIEVFMIGGGGGGAGCSASAAVAGSAGGASTFNAVNANGGSGGPASSTTNAPGGAGGTGGTGTATRRQPGGPGGTAFALTGQADSGNGGTGYFGGGALGIANAGANAAGNSAAVNTGSGGGGAITGAGPNAGGGGGSGEFVYLIINNPAATYTYTVGTSGTGGSSTNNGGNGGTGFIFVIEHYNY